MAQDQSTTETFSIVFDGGLAERGELHFYEYGRAAYAAARLVNTIEHFRRTGRVPKRISNRNYVDLKIKAPEKGSFPLDILIPLAIEAHKIIVEYDIPVTEFVKYIIHLIKRIIPEREDKIIALAKIDLDRERERTAQSAEETKRIQAIRDMVHSSNINTNAAIDVLQRTITAVDTRIPQIADQREIKEILSELLEAKAREESFEPYKDTLEKIGEDKLVRLSRKVRPQLAEVGLPLRRSATNVSFIAGADKEKFATFDEQSLRDLNSRDLDQNVSDAELRVFAYDRDMGAGKCDDNTLDIKRISFSVPIGLRKRLRRKVLAAIDVDAIEAKVRYFRNKDSQVTSMLLEEIIEMEDVEAPA